VYNINEGDTYLHSGFTYFFNKGNEILKCELLSAFHHFDSNWTGGIILLGVCSCDTVFLLLCPKTAEMLIRHFHHDVNLWQTGHKLTDIFASFICTNSFCLKIIGLTFGVRRREQIIWTMGAVCTSKALLICAATD